MSVTKGDKEFFVVQLRLDPTEQQRVIMRRRFAAGKQAYNAILQEGLRRLDSLDLRPNLSPLKAELDSAAARSREAVDAARRPSIRRDPEARAAADAELRAAREAESEAGRAYRRQRRIEYREATSEDREKLRAHKEAEDALRAEAKAAPKAKREELRKRINSAKDRKMADSYSSPHHTASMSYWMPKLTGGDLAYHLCSDLLHALCERACKAIERHIKPPRGIPFCGRPRFKSEIESVNGRNNKAGLRRDGLDIIWSAGASCPKDQRALTLRLHVDDQHQRLALERETKIVRVLRRVIRGEERWFAQLTQIGRSPKARQKGSGIVAVDVGPSVIAIYTDRKAILRSLAPGVDIRIAEHDREKRRLLRRLDRQRRAGNPQNYHPTTGQIIPRAQRRWNAPTKAMRRTLAALQDCQRRMAAYRKNMHGRLVSEIVALGDVIHIEENWRTGWSREDRMSRSVGRHAPGAFVAQLKQVAATEGLAVRELPSAQLRLSHRCICGVEEEKPLSQRWHRCDCGATAPRNLFAAFLSRHVGDDGLDIEAAQKAWWIAREVVAYAVEDALARTDEHWPTALGLGPNVDDEGMRRVEGVPAPRTRRRGAVRAHRPGTAKGRRSRKRKASVAVDTSLRQH